MLEQCFLEQLSFNFDQLGVLLVFVLVDLLDQLLSLVDIDEYEMIVVLDKFVVCGEVCGGVVVYEFGYCFVVLVVVLLLEGSDLLMGLLVVVKVLCQVVSLVEFLVEYDLMLICCFESVLLLDLFKFFGVFNDVLQYEGILLQL